jgi:HPt (histidine-containing phosphotransfer) domain-containing protein
MPESQPEFDWSQAESLLGEDAENVPEEMAEIVRELVEGSKKRFAEMAKLDPGSDRAEIGSQAHQLRGSLLNFGFVGVGDLLYDIEKKECSPQDYPGLVAAADRAFRDSLKILGERYPKLRLD